MKESFTLTSVAALVLVAGVVHAASPLVDEPPKPEPSPTQPTAVAAPPVVAPFGLRGLGVGTSVRIDQTFAPYNVADKGYFESVHFVSASLKVSDTFALSLRTGVDRYGPSGESTTSGFLNTALGVQGATKLGRWFRFAASSGVVLPTANGGGNTPDASVAAAHKAGTLVRAFMAGSMFAANDLNIPLGVDFGFVARGFTAQLETGFSAGFRVRGELVQADSTKVNSTSGLLVGYYVVPEVSIGGELWYQRYLTTPAAVEKDPSQRDNLSVAGGVRATVKGAGATFRPGVSYGVGLRGQVSDKHVHMVQIDLPVSF